MTEHAFDPAEAFNDPEGLLKCSCGWPEMGLKNMKMHIANPDAGVPETLTLGSVVTVLERPRGCKEDFCANRHFALGLCATHYRRRYRKHVKKRKVMV